MEKRKKVSWEGRKKQYQVFSLTGKLLYYSRSLLVKNLSQLRYTNKKKFSHSRTQHLFLVGEVENEPVLRNVKLLEETKVVYYPKKYDGFKVEWSGKGVFDIEEFEGYDIYCGLRKYHAHLTLIEKP